MSTSAVVPPDPLEEIWAKLQRSQEHVHEAKTVADTFYGSGQLYTRRSEQDRKGRLVVKVVSVHPPPPILSILIGEAVYQLRSSLDHLMFLLAKPTTRKEERDVQFPLVKTRRAYIAGTRHMMPGVARGVRTVIESLQPYHSRKPYAASLGYLRDISNWDKHRALATTAASIEDSDMRLQVIGGTSVVGHEAFRGPLKPGAVLARYTLAYLKDGAEVSMGPELTLVPSFDSSMPKPIAGIPINSTLTTAGYFITHEVIPSLRKFL